MRTSDAIRVLLVDRHRVMLWGLQKVIEQAATRMLVVGAATAGGAALEIAAKESPDVVVLDTALLKEDPTADILAFINRHNARVLLFCGLRDSKLHEAAILRGACGVVHKDDSPETLLKAIAKVHEGQLWLDRSTTGRIFVELSRQKNDPVAQSGRQKLESLTEREQDVVRTLVCEPGADNKKLARNLHIGEHTLRNHLSRIYDKLGVPNRVELYVFAQRYGVRQRNP